MEQVETVVIGNGLFGSAAARHLCELGESVAIVGPDEPPDHARHKGVFASHYDDGRLLRLADRNPTWASITRRAVASYRRLEDATGVDFYHPVGALIVIPPEDVDGDTDASPLSMMRACEIAHTVYPPGDRAWRAEFPQLDLPDTHYVIHEPAPAGYINPRRLIEAQNAAAAANGAVVVREMASGVDSTGAGVTVTVPSGTQIRAEKALVAAGAFTNFNGLLPLELPLKIETEVIALGKVSPEDARILQTAPTVTYPIDHPVLDSIYMVPPVRYGDGDFYIKLGANTTSDQVLTTLPDIQAWFRSGDSDFTVPSFEAVLRGLWPHTTILSVRSKR